jgi:hypothetical protein
VSLNAPDPSRQVAFHQLLVSARKQWLVDALGATLAEVDPKAVMAELAQYAPADALGILAGAGVRAEQVFPTPTVLAAKPSLIGYYRLLLGVPQKSFYTGATGMTLFKSMEMRDTMIEKQGAALGAFCSAMAVSLADLVRQLSPTVTARDVTDLPLLVLGSQFQGGNNNTIGKRATLEVFLAIAEIVELFIEERDDRRLFVRNASGRNVVIALAADPDVRIQEQFEDLRPKVAIEIKGGTDRSNVHNRAGEAEKSHQKARADGYREFWTLIGTTGVDMDRLRQESPTTDSWFDASQVLAREGRDYEEFRSRIAGAVGIGLEPAPT